MRLLIGYDGSDGSRAAILSLHRAGLPADTEASVICLADVWPAMPIWAYVNPAKDPDWQKSPMLRRAQGLAAEAVARAQALAEEGDALVRSEFSTWKVTHRYRTGSPSAVLVEPQEPAPHLVVVGSHGQSAISRLVLGSVSCNVLNHATCSVRISREMPKANHQKSEPIRIILGVDGSKASELAFRAILNRQWPAGTEVKLIAVLDLKFWSVLPNPGSPVWSSMEDSRSDGRTWASAALEAMTEQLRRAGLVGLFHIEDGDPKTVLLSQANLWNADCIFLGAKGHGTMERLLLGSVSAAVASHAECSVEVVR